MHSWVLFLFATCLPAVWLMDQKALDEFVNLPDTHYEYTFQERKVLPFLGIAVNYDIINMTSQKWLTESEVDKPVWSHELTIVVPKVKKLADSCLLIIRPGEDDEAASSNLAYTGHTLIAASKIKSIIAMLRPVLIQPLTFYDHPLGRENITGYDIVAYSWWKFMSDPTVPPEWLVQFPMVKATMRAMDTIIDYVRKEYHRDITRFTLTGISMGGWISWLTAAVDKRVEAIIPIAMDFLNFTESFHHQYRAYCGWSYMLRPFYEMNITRELDNPRFSELASHVDPLAYNDRYTNTDKYIIVLSGDELFQPDNSRYYFSQLEGVKYLQIIPNIGYGFVDERVFTVNITIFYFRIVEKEYGLPNVSWEIKMTNTSGIITLRAFNVHRVYSYHADTVGGTRRDFRMRIAAGSSTKKNPVKWIRTDVEKVERNVYKKEMQMPKKGWRAFFLQVNYPYDRIGAYLAVTSEVLIMPDTFPCSDCSGEECHGTLV